MLTSRPIFGPALLPLLLVFLTIQSAATTPGETNTVRSWNEYRVIMWIADSAYKQADKIPLFFQRLREMGVNTGMVYDGGNAGPLSTNQFPFYVENMVNRDLCLKWNSKVQDWDPFVSRWAKTRDEASFVREYPLDPDTPVGIEGTQMPHAYGGYDLWRLSQSLDWVEPYDVGNAREIFGSFMPAKPILTTVFEKETLPARRRLWHLLLEGDRGCIIWWSEDCIDWQSPDYRLTAKAKALAPVLQEITSPLARLFLRAQRQFDPIAIHYSQASIQAD